MYPETSDDVQSLKCCTYLRCYLNEAKAEIQLKKLWLLPFNLRLIRLRCSQPASSYISSMPNHLPALYLKPLQIISRPALQQAQDPSLLCRTLIQTTHLHPLLHHCSKLIRLLLDAPSTSPQCVVPPHFHGVPCHFKRSGRRPPRWAWFCQRFLPKGEFFLSTVASCLLFMDSSWTVYANFVHSVTSNSSITLYTSLYGLTKLHLSKLHHQFQARGKYPYSHTSVYLH